MADVVYLLERDGLYKIGMTWKLSQRLRSFPRASVIHIIPVRYQKLRELEGLLLCYFRDVCISGEWFALRPLDVALICTINDWPNKAAKTWLKYPPL